MNASTKTWLLAGSAIVPWGCSFLINKLVLAELSPAVLSLYRWLLAAGVFLAYAIITSRRRQRPLLGALRRQPVIFLALAVLCLPVPYLAQNYALQWTSVINVSVLMDADPVFIVLLGALLLGERVRAVQFVGVLVALAGTVMVTTSGGALSLGSQDTVGNLLAVLAACSWAAYTVLLKVAARDHDAFTITVLTTTIGTLFLIPPAVAEGLTWPSHGGTILGVVFLGLLCSAWGTLAWVYVLEKMDASRAAPLIFLIPIIASALSIAVLGEQPSAFTLVGAAMILGGVLVSEGSERGGVSKAGSRTPDGWSTEVAE